MIQDENENEIKTAVCNDFQFELIDSVPSVEEDEYLALVLCGSQYQLFKYHSNVWELLFELPDQVPYLETMISGEFMPVWYEGENGASFDDNESSTSQVTFNKLLLSSTGDNDLFLIGDVIMFRYFLFYK